MVKILDSTLREGEQTPGVCFPPHTKLAIAKELDNIGVEYIEAGHPFVSEKIYNSVKTLANEGLNAIVGAHSRSLEKDIDRALDCGVGFLGIFYCVSNDRLNGVFDKNLDEAVQQIAYAIKYAKEQNPNLIVRYTPEDTVRSNWDNIVTASVKAVRAGADIISIADTTGYMIPGIKNRNMYDFVTSLKEKLADEDLYPKIAVHCHNDRGLALANALDSYRAGVDIIDTTVLGLGERTGITDLASLLHALKVDFKTDNNWNLKKLPQLYNLISKFSGVPIPANQPLVGKNAFTHCAGVHTQAAAKDPVHYQSVDPALVGREMKVSLDHMSGISSIKYALVATKLTHIDLKLIPSILREVKTVGESGRTVEIKEFKDIVESVLSMRRHTSDYTDLTAKDI